MNIISQLICLWKGHSPENYFKETDGYISTIKCSRCNTMLMGGFVWKIKNIPPPNSTPDQIIEWEKYCEFKWQKLRNSFA